MTNRRRKTVLFLAMVFALALAPLLLLTPEQASASHAWGPYHWARTANPFTLQLVDNVGASATANWDPYLVTTSGDWSVSSVLDTTIVAGLATGTGNCGAVNGKVRVCNKTYGFTGWLGLAQIWVSGSHIVKGVAKLNDTYFNTSTYNNPGWRNLVMCQEVGHTFGLAHQDEVFNNTNLGSCMDYTNNPLGPPNNEHPNAHDYDQLGLIYAHLDSSTTVASSINGAAFGQDEAGPDGPHFGQPVRGHKDLFVRDLGKGRKLFTWVTWAR